MEKKTELEVQKIRNESLLLQKHKEHEKQRIDNQMFIDSQKAKSDAYFYRATLESQSQKQLLSSAYLELLILKSRHKELVLCFGPNIPNTEEEREALIKNL